MKSRKKKIRDQVPKLCTSFLVVVEERKVRQGPASYPCY